MRKNFKSIVVLMTASIASFSFGSIMDVLKEKLFGIDFEILIIIGVVGIIAWLVTVKLSVKEVKPIVSAPIELITPQDRLDEARKGLIVFVSLYSSKLTDEEISAAIKNKDYDKLDFINSNLGSTIESILIHQSALEHCWLVTTTSTSSDKYGSLVYSEILVNYLQDIHHLQCTFHIGNNYSILLDTDAMVTQRTIKVIEKIYEEAEKKYSLKEKDIVADITSGLKSMSLGMILSCIDSARDIQFIGVKYDDNGKIIFSKKTPILYDISVDVFE